MTSAIEKEYGVPGSLLPPPGVPLLTQKASDVSCLLPFPACDFHGHGVQYGWLRIMCQHGKPMWSPRQVSFLAFHCPRQVQSAVALVPDKHLCLSVCLFVDMFLLPLDGVLSVVFFILPTTNIMCHDMNMGSSGPFGMP